ncbi:nitroreductase/quinone reductase family protein [Actinoallomurus sp. CA-142502]|uniref:nitroreductase/quinone reductase family protein n=1 Tax=Actinoallomurus sp. CA-142502 TaxID=3239885 RepID=UPI003D917744
MSDWNQKIIEEFRANGGAVGGPFEGTPLVLLTTVGARTGRRRTTPVTCLRDGGRILVFASNAGAPAHPAWYHNLLANPGVTVETGEETYAATAQPLEEAERDALYARQAEIAPAFADYQAGTSRVIPVVALYRDQRARALGDELVAIHRGMREELAGILSAVSDLAAGRPAEAPPADLAARLRSRCLSFCADVHAHHDNEAGRGFPLLARRYPGLEPVLAAFGEEHAVLAGIRSRFEETLARAASPDEVLDELRELAGEIEAHFDREERRLVPALNAL